MAFDGELLRAEVYREFGLADSLGLEESKRLAFVELDEDGTMPGFHITDGEEQRSAKSKSNAAHHAATMADPKKAEKRRTQKRDSARRAYARVKGIASVVMSDGSVWRSQ